MTEPPTLLSRLLRKKPIELLARDMGSPEDAEHKHLKRGITPFQLTMFGVGSTIGTGIFFVLSETVPTAGPAVIVSFLIAGLVAGLTALCYAEMASMIPVSGSSYSYAYVTLGEGVAFFVACCLILEYGISAAAVAVGWSGYLNKVVEIVFGSGLPTSLLAAPLVADGHRLHFGGDGILNLPAVILVLLCALLLIRGATESAKANAIMVMIKLGILAMFILIAVTGFSAENLKPFAPHGFAGVSAAAGTIFFTYVGLDAVSTAGEEVENPKKNLPIAIIAALLIVTSLYVLGRGDGVGCPAGGRLRRPGSRPCHDPAEPDRQRMAGSGAGLRRRDLCVQRDPGRALRPDPDPVRHVARRAAAGALLSGQPAHALSGRLHCRGSRSSSPALPPSCRMRCSGNSPAWGRWLPLWWCRPASSSCDRPSRTCRAAFGFRCTRCCRSSASFPASI